MARVKPSRMSSKTQHARLVWLYGVEGVYPKTPTELKKLTGVSLSILSTYLEDWNQEREDIARERFLETDIMDTQEAYRQKHLKHIKCIEGQMEAIAVRMDMLDVEDPEHQVMSDRYLLLKKEWEADTGMMGAKEGSSAVEKVKTIVTFQQDSGVQMLPDHGTPPPPEAPRQATGRVVAPEFDV